MTTQITPLKSTEPPTGGARWRIVHQDEQAVVLQHGDVAPEPHDWVQRLCDPLKLLHNVAAVGAKRLDAQGRLFSMGEFVIHPKGYHSLGRETEAAAFRFPEEVDAIAGGVLAVKRDAFEQAGGLSRLDGALGAIDLCLTLRHQGGRCLCVPQVLVVDEHEPSPGEAEVRAFAGRWGFDWRCADLDVVQQRYAGTGLLWQARFHTAALPFEKYDNRPAFHWQSYAGHEPYRQRADFLVKWVNTICPGGRVLDMGCGDGLFAHLFALQGAQVTGVDCEQAAIEQAIQQTAKHTYPNGAPTFVHGDAHATEDNAASYDLVTMFDVIEHLPNPVALLRQAAGLIKPGGLLMVTTPAWQYGHWSDAVYHVTEYTLAELTAQIQHATGMTIAKCGRIGGVYRDLIVTAKKS